MKKPRTVRVYVAIGWAWCQACQQRFWTETAVGFDWCPFCRSDMVLLPPSSLVELESTPSSY